jgi:uncharacterized protein YkwD
MRVAPLALIASTVLALAGPSAGATVAKHPCHATGLVPSVGNIGRVERAARCLVNRERARHGERALIADRRLTRAARSHSHDMAVRHYFEHVSPDGQTPLQRIQESGFLPAGHGYLIGENIAWGSGTLSTPAQIVRAWMHSPGHRANILNRRFRYTGMGVVADVPVETLRFQPGGIYTQDFATVFP